MSVCRGGAVPCLPGGSPVAGRIYLPKVWRAKGVACATRATDLRRLPSPSHSDCWDHFPRQPFAVAAVVPRDLACDEPEERGQCAWVAARPGLGQLSDRVDGSS